jgi:hypothetical protein
VLGRQLSITLSISTSLQTPRTSTWGSSRRRLRKLNLQRDTQFTDTVSDITNRSQAHQPHSASSLLSMTPTSLLLAPANPATAPTHGVSASSRLPTFLFTAPVSILSSTITARVCSSLSYYPPVFSTLTIVNNHANPSKKLAPTVAVLKTAKTISSV